MLILWNPLDQELLKKKQLQSPLTPWHLKGLEDFMPYRRVALLLFWNYCTKKIVYQIYKKQKWNQFIHIISLFIFSFFIFHFYCDFLCFHYLGFQKFLTFCFNFSFYKQKLRKGKNYWTKTTELLFPYLI